MLHARPARVRARRRMTGIAMTTVALFALSACGGDPEAQETVGPTAGSDPSSTAQAYEPTLPPYTSDVDLTDEETEQVEDLLILIDEFNILTSSLSDESVDKAKSLEGQVDEELLEWHLSDMSSNYADGIRTRGVIIPESATILSFDDTRSTISICYSFDDYVIYDDSDPDTPIYTDRPNEYSFETDAVFEDDQWIVSGRRDSRISCDEH